MEPLPFGFDQELVNKYRKSLEDPILAQGAHNEAAAHSGAIERGLTGTPFETLGTAAAKGNTQRAVAGVNSDLAWKMAGLTNQDARTKAGWDFQSKEAEKDRVLRREQSQDEEEGGLFAGLGSIAGGVLGGPIGAGIGGSIGNLFKKKAATPQGSQVPYYLAKGGGDWAPPSW